MPRTANTVIWTEVTVKLNVHVGEVATLDKFKNVCLKVPGALPEDFNDYSNWPEYLHDYKRGIDARSLKIAYERFIRYLESQREISVEVFTDNKKTRLVFIKLSKKLETKFQDQPLSYVTTSERIAKRLQGCSDYDPETHGKMIADYRENITKVTYEKGKELRIKYSKPQ
jgi:hypothetical protein